MKKILLLFTLIPFLGFSQIQSGKILYKVKMTEDFSRFADTTGMSDHAKRFYIKGYTNLKKSVHQISHPVIFNKNEGISTTQELMDSDAGHSIKSTQMATYTDVIYYFDFKNRTSTQQLKNFGETLRVVLYTDSLEWKLHNEFKEIQGYICQKATVAYTFNHLVKNDISVWFAKDLPFSIGPIGIAGLPGAILEFEKSGMIFYADKIELSKKDLQINPLTAGKAMTSEEYQKMSIEENPMVRDFMEKKQKGEI